MKSFFQIGRRLCILSLLGGLCAMGLPGVGAGAPSAPPLSAPALQALAQDAAGTVWAIPLNNNGFDHTNDGRVYRWQGKAWAAQSISGAAGFRQRTLTRGDDGAVYVLWERGSDSLVTVHRGIGSRILVRFTAAFGPDLTDFNAVQRSLWVGTGSDVWIADGKFNLWHISLDGTVGTFPSDPNYYFGGRYVAGFPGQPLSSLVDSQGRRWFWQGISQYWDPNGRRGVLIWDGRTLAYHPTLTGLPDCPFSVLVPHDPRHFWAAVLANPYLVPHADSGLFQIDTKTLTAVRIAPPFKNAFQNLVRVFQINGVWYVLTNPTMDQTRVRLWRRQGSVWHEGPSALADSLYGVTDLMPQAALEMPTGTWLAVFGAGAWWVPKNGKSAVRVDWRRGLTLGRVSNLFALPSGKILAFSGSAALLPPLPHALYPPRPGVQVGGQAVPVAVTGMVSDPRRHLWGLVYLAGNQRALEEWDGRQWHPHRLPKDILGVNDYCNLYAGDTRGRLWLATTNWASAPQSQPVDGRAVYDPARDTWTKYRTVPDALQAASSLPGMAFLPNRVIFRPPAFSGDGQAAFADNLTLFLYDGHLWRHWSKHEVRPSDTDMNFEDLPRFNAAGHLEIDVQQETYEWTPEGGWQVSGPVKPAIAEPDLPPGGPVDYHESPITDNLGARWVACDGDLYLIRHGQWLKETALSGLGSPFGDGRGLTDVLQDSNGHYFFLTTPGGLYEYVVWSPAASSPPAASLPPSAPRLQITALSADSVLVRFASDGRSQLQFQWRLNGGAWSASQKTETVRLKALPPGSYRVEVQSIDTLLQASPIPSAAEFVIQPASPAQIARWVRTLLSGTEDAREAAVAGLVKQPADALPALKAARQGASDTGLWWLDAAIQQITPADDLPKPAYRE